MCTWNPINQQTEKLSTGAAEAAHRSRNWTLETARWRYERAMDSCLGLVDATWQIGKSWISMDGWMSFAQIFCSLVEGVLFMTDLVATRSTAATPNESPSNGEVNVSLEDASKAEGTSGVGQKGCSVMGHISCG